MYDVDPFSSAAKADRARMRSRFLFSDVPSEAAQHALARFDSGIVSLDVNPHMIRDAWGVTNVSRMFEHQRPYFSSADDTALAVLLQLIVSPSDTPYTPDDYILGMFADDERLDSFIRYCAKASLLAKPLGFDVVLKSSESGLDFDLLNSVAQ